MKAFVFPGQGSQFVGMGKDLYDNNALAKELFEEVSESEGREMVNDLANIATEFVVNAN